MLIKEKKPEMTVGIAEEIIQEEFVKALKYIPVAELRLKKAFEFLENNKLITEKELFNMTLKKEMDSICKALKEDEGYRIAWESNIAMAFKDEWSRHFKYNEAPSGRFEDIHKIANNAAKNFISNLIMDRTEENHG